LPSAMHSSWLGWRFFWRAWRAILTDALIIDKTAPPMLAASYVAARRQLIGKMASRTLLPGLPVPILAIREPYAVRQGEKVAIVVETSVLRLTALAVALQPGSEGERVDARNLDSGIVVSGVVQPDRTLRVELP